MNRFLKDKEHLVRMAALFAVGVVLFLILKAVLVPKGFGVYGHYRAGALADNRVRAPRFAGRSACIECHTDERDAWKGGTHEEVRGEERRQARRRRLRGLPRGPRETRRGSLREQCLQARPEDDLLHLPPDERREAEEVPPDRSEEPLRWRGGSWLPLSA